MGALAACLVTRQAGGEPILNLACRDKNRLALASEALGAAALGVSTILCMTGDHTTHGDHPESKPVYDLDSVQALLMLKGLAAGKDLNGNPLTGSPQFCLGGVVTPEADPPEPQMLKFVKKAEIGLDFFQTQAVFEIDRLREFIKKAREYGAKVIIGVRVLSGSEIAEYRDGSLPGVLVPAALIGQLRQAGEGEGTRKAQGLAADLIREIKGQNLGDGVHIMAMGQEHRIPEILSKAGL
jgi:5,10-methylenetetrahydrofolate reductase